MGVAWKSPTLTLPPPPRPPPHPPQGCSFSPNVDGGPEEAIATITIQSDIALRQDADRLAEMLHFNVDNVKLGAFNWAEQV